MPANPNPPQSVSNAQDKIALPTQPQYQPKPHGFVVNSVKSSGSLISHMDKITL
ncbi:hypothetical protein C1H46_012424 [Malus baccata]|uniref:Uncharacterized protein n=1 Tax=Malus baccata TaxID=106549 RepID=A0A540MUE5_MALBA|nr:hypothetical protein C1H46_012424 [Malus baccata]